MQCTIAPIQLVMRHLSGWLPWLLVASCVSMRCAFALQLQPLPPNTEISVLVKVTGSVFANDSFWGDKCTSIPSNTLFIVVDMGGTAVNAREPTPPVRDFFKPTGANTSYCDMLQAHDKHQWSPDGLNWFRVGFDSYTPHNGGSAEWWPRSNGREGDTRQWLSFWGVDDTGPVKPPTLCFFLTLKPPTAAFF